MRMDKYDKYKRLKPNSKIGIIIRKLEDVYNNITDYAAAVVMLLDIIMDYSYYAVLDFIFELRGKIYEQTYV